MKIVTKITTTSPITSWQIYGETMKTVTHFIFCVCAPKSLQMVTATLKLKDAFSLEENYDQPRQHIKKQRHYFADKDPSSQTMIFQVVTCRCESCTIEKVECQKINLFWTVGLAKSLVSPLDCKEIQPFHPKGNQSWIFIGRTDAKAETPVLWLSYWKNWLIWKESWCRKRLKVGGERDDRGWDGWMASLTQWTWVWESFSSW